MKHLKNIVGAIVLSALFVSFNTQADQTGNCTAGEEFCEQNSLATTNTTTTTNTNTNTNSNTNVNTNTNSKTNSNTNINTTESSARTNLSNGILLVAPFLVIGICCIPSTDDSDNC